MALSLSIFLLSASILSFEIIVIRLLSISHWQPFVTLAISTALLGYGLSGSLLVRFRKRAFVGRSTLYPALTAAAALSYGPVAGISSRLSRAATTSSEALPNLPKASAAEERTQ